MNSRPGKILYWIPRILGLLFAFFIGLFALDVLNENYSFGKTIVAFLVHLIPTYIVLLFTIIAWRKEGIGSMLFTIIGLAYVINFKDQPFLTYAIISGPLFLIAILFLLNNFLHGREEKKKGD